MRKSPALCLLAAAVLAVSAPEARAAEQPEGPDLQVRVANFHVAQVRVYAEDAHGRLHSLGRVGRAQFKVLALPESLVEMGEVRLKFFPSEGLGSPIDDSQGIRTNDLSLSTDDSVYVMLETELTDSSVRVISG